MPLKPLLESFKELAVSWRASWMCKKEDIVLINLVVKSARDAEKIALYIGRCGGKQICGNEEWRDEGERKEAYFARSQGHVMNAKTKRETCKL